MHVVQQQYFWHEIWLTCISTCIYTCIKQSTVFPRIIAGVIIIFYSSKRGQLFQGERLIVGGDYFKYCVLEVLIYSLCADVLIREL